VISKKTIAEVEAAPTFSIPKNLSVPSLLMGPAFCNILTRGVISGSGSASFFLDDGEFAPGLEFACHAFALVMYLVAVCVDWTKRRFEYCLHQSPL